MKENINIIKNDSEFSVSFSYIEKNKLGIAESSIFPVEIINNMVSELGIDVNLLKNEINNASKIYYFNRLNVPKEIQNKGIGKQLLISMLNYMKENNYFLINTINAYGTLNKEELIDFYVKNGMKILSEEEGIVYYYNNKLEAKLKMKK